MANPNNPHGLFPLGTSVHGGAVTIQEFTKAAALATAIFRNDVVVRVAGGTLSAAAADFIPGTTNISGVALNYGALSLLTTHSVIVEPGALYEGQSVNALAAADMGKNANVTLVQAGSTATKFSGTQIDESTKAATATLDLHLIQLYGSIDNAFGQNNRIEVVFNKHRMNGATVGV